MAVIRCQHLTFTNIAAVIFDKDGTLANSEAFLKQLGEKRSQLLEQEIPGIGASLRQMFGLVGDRLNPAGALAVGSRRENEIAAAAYIAATGKDWVQSLAIAQNTFKAADQYFPRKADYTAVFPGALACLRSLKAGGVKTAILSSDSTANVQDFAQRYELEAYFDLLMGTGQGPTKPDPQLLLQACASLGVEPAQTLMVGDSSADLVMARSARVAGGIGVTWGWAEPLSLPNADVAIARWDEIEVLTAE
ncbi:MAG TPA: HAD family hydrolase [Allocoleopsis sp.]